MIPSVILEGRLILADEANYLAEMFPGNGVQAMPRRDDEKGQADDGGFCAGVQALITLA